MEIGECQFIGTVKNSPDFTPNCMAIMLISPPNYTNFLRRVKYIISMERSKKPVSQIPMNFK